MTGKKTLKEVRAELEAAFGRGPTGDDEVAQALRRFLNRGKKASPKNKKPGPGKSPK